MAVADGHHGTAASHAVVEAIHRAAPRLADLEPEEAAVEACLFARDALACCRPRSDGSVHSATTLTVAAISGDREPPPAGATRWRCRCAAAVPHPSPTRAHVFVAAGTAVAPPPEPASFRLKPSDVVVLATDGLVDFLPPPWERSLAHLLDPVEKPEQGIRAAAEAAAAGGGGDNLAICLFSR
jgi:serine/threonine protein phosphatase PrpC